MFDRNYFLAALSSALMAILTHFPEINVNLKNRRLNIWHTINQYLADFD